MLFVFLLVLLSPQCFADYNCVCNYAVEKGVYPEPNVSSTPIGMLYEFDCKETLDINSASGWLVLAYEHKIGFIQDGNDIQVQICQGLPSDLDTVTTTTTAATTISTSSTTSSLLSTTPYPRSTTGTRLSVDSQTTQTTNFSTPLKVSPSTATTSKRTTAPPSSTTRRTITLKPNIPQVSSGNINLCPSNLHRYTLEDGGALTQYGDKCYELVPIRTTWSKALGDCRAKGGTLFTIQGQAFQNYIYQWILSYKFDHAVWIGLTDLLQEENFEWVSGARVTYTNWYKDRFGNLASHHVEDCVLLVPYSPYFGKWDDAHCGETSLFGLDSGQTSPFICEFSIQNSIGSLIG